MKVYELVDKLLKLPAGMDVEVRFDSDDEKDIFDMTDLDELHYMLATARITHVCKPADIEQSFVELMCRIK